MDFELATGDYEVHAACAQGRMRVSHVRRDRTWRAVRTASCVRTLEVRPLVSCCHRKRAARVQLVLVPHLQNLRNGRPPPWPPCWQRRLAAQLEQQPTETAVRSF